MSPLIPTTKTTVMMIASVSESSPGAAERVGASVGGVVTAGSPMGKSSLHEGQIKSSHLETN